MVASVLSLRIPSSIRIFMRLATLCLLLYWLAIFTATHLPKKSMPVLLWSDKVLHAMAFTGLSFLLAWAIPRKSGKWLSHLLITAGIAFAYACIDEFTQKFIPGRACEIWDVAADACGIACGLSVYSLLRLVLMQFSLGRAAIIRLAR